MPSFAKVILFLALAFCAFYAFLFIIGGGAAGKQVDALKGLIFGGAVLAACLFCAYRFYLGSGLSRCEWIALLVALSPIALIIFQVAYSNGASADAETGADQ